VNWFHQLPEFLVLGITRGSMYALIAIGYTLVYGVLQLINFAHSEVFMSGTFGSYLVVEQLVPHSGHAGPVHVVIIVLVGILAGAAVSSAVAWVVERIAYRSLRRRGAPKLAFLISAIGTSFFLSQLAGKLFNRFNNNPFPVYFKDRTLFHIGTAEVRVVQLMVVAAAVVCMIALDRLVQGTKLGRSIRAVAEDAPTAALMGIDIDKTISRTFLLGGILAGVAAFLFGTAYGFSYQVGFNQGNKAFAAAVLGGIGNIRGAMLGGLLLGIAEAVIPPLSFIGIAWTDVVAFVILVVILIVRPTGILGEKLGRAA